MGRWKYINGLLIVVIMGFMYRYFAVRYEASLMVYVLSTAGALITAALGFYIFVYKIREKPENNRAKNNKAGKVNDTERPKMSPGQRPRVVLKKGRDDNH